jgi:hypothetical protein
MKFPRFGPPVPLKGGWIQEGIIPPLGGRGQAFREGGKYMQDEDLKNQEINQLFDI